MRRVERGQQQRQPRLLPARQARHDRIGLIRHKPEPRQPRPQPGLAFLGAQAEQVLKGRFLGPQLVHLVLGKVPHAQLARPRHPPPHRRQPPGDQLRQRRLALAVPPQQRDPVVLVQPQVELLQHGRAVIADGRAFHRHDGRRQLLGRRKAEHMPRRFLGRGDRRHLLQHLDARLRLPGLRRLGLEPVHEGLQVRAPGVLLLGLGRLHGALLGAGAGKGVVAPRPQRQLAVVQMQDRPHRAVQEAAVVADDEDRMGILREVAFQPKGAFKVEVVGRFVQKQQVGGGKQHTGQRDPHPPPARERRTGHPLFRVGEAQPLQDRGRPPLGRPGVDVGQPRLDIGNPRRIGRVGRLVHQGGAFGVGRQHGVEQRHLRPRHLLRHAADARAGGNADAPAFQRQLPPDQPEQRRLARTVAANKPHLVPGRNRGTGALEQRASVDGIGDVLDPQHGGALADPRAVGKRM